MSEKKTPDYMIQSIAKYQKANVKSYLVKVNKNTEGEIIEKLESVPSKQGYIKDLIKKDIKSERNDDNNV